MIWSETEVARLRELAAQGCGSRRAAKQMRGRTPGMVAGKLSRMSNAPRTPRPRGASKALYRCSMHVNLDAGMREDLNATAKARGISRDQLVREYLEWALEEFA